MSTIDDLQRLHEAATHERNRPFFWMSQTTAESMNALHNAWPAIHRVLVAARAWRDAPFGGIAGEAALAEMNEALRALDDKERRT